MKLTERIIVYAALLVLIILWHRSCESNKEAETKVEKIEIPKIIGNFDQEKPDQEKIDVDSIANLVRDTISPRVKIVKKASKSNDSLLKAYKELESEFDRLKLFQSFISTKSFKKDFKNDDLKIGISGVVRGKIESIGIDYFEIKEREKEFEYEIPKPDNWHLGPYLGYDLINQKASFGVSVTYSIISF